MIIIYVCHTEAKYHIHILLSSKNLRDPKAIDRVLITPNIVIITKSEYIDTKDALIDKDEFNETIKYLDRIKEEAMTFVEEYVQHVSGSRKMDPREFKRRYTYSPLIYFHQELGI